MKLHRKCRTCGTIYSIGSMGTAELGRTVVEHVAKATEREAEEIFGRTLAPAIVLARAAAAHIMREDCELTWERCAEVLGRERTTAMNLQKHWDDPYTVQMRADAISSMRTLLTCHSCKAARKAAACSL